MKKIACVAFLCLMPFGALAAGAAGPVEEVMDITAKNWAEEDGEGQYLFDDALLARLFSKAFVAQYREAAKHPAYDTEDGAPGDPFGYDVITNSQDGCPLKDVVIKPGAQKAGGVTEVTVTFKPLTCIDDAAVKDAINEVHFDLISEGGETVINDIHRVVEGRPDSLLEEMRDIAAGE